MREGRALWATLSDMGEDPEYALSIGLIDRAEFNQIQAYLGEPLRLLEFSVSAKRWYVLNADGTRIEIIEEKQGYDCPVCDGLCAVYVCEGRVYRECEDITVVRE